MGIKFQIVGTGITLTFFLMSCGFQGPDSHETTWEPEISTTANQSLASDSERPVTFLRGDVNGDGESSLADVTFLTNYLFLGGVEPGCMDAADINDDGHLDISDATYLVRFLFWGEANPPEPFALPGQDPSQDLLGCVQSLEEEPEVEPEDPQPRPRNPPPTRPNPPTRQPRCGDCVCLQNEPATCPQDCQPNCSDWR